MPGVRVELAARKFTLPSECPCCGAPPDAELGVTAASSGQTLGFPYCQRCVAHVRSWEASGVGSAGVMVLAIIAAIVAAVTGAILAAVAIFVVGASLAWWLRTARRTAARRTCGESCAAPGRAVGYLGWSGTTSAFTFASPTFAARFAEANPSLLANVTPQLRKLIDGYHKARLAVPTPALAAGVAPPPLTARDWQARIEATSGVVARRIALSRALEMVDEPQARRELLQTVARLELAPLVDKLQRASTATAKRGLITTAIAEVRADNIEDELQAAILDRLEARLAEL